MNISANKIKIPLVAIMVLICLHAIFFGSFLEEYEGVFSALVHGTYTFPYTNKWGFDNHTILFALYSRINLYFENIQVYGVFLYVLAIVTAIIFGLVLYKILQKVNTSSNNLMVFGLLYTIFLLDYLQNISYNRITIVGIVLIFIQLELFQNNDKKIKLLSLVFICLSILFLCLLNFETVLVLSVLYLFVLVILKRFHFTAILPFLISLLCTISYLVYMTHFANETSQVYFFKELEFFDRLNIDYKNLDKLAMLEVNLLRRYIMFDDYHFTLSFYDDVAKYKPDSIFSNILNGLKLESIKQNILASVPNAKEAIVSIIFSIFSFVLLVTKHIKKTKKLFLFVVLLLFPIVLTTYFVLPITFIETYYCLMGILFMLWYFLKTSKMHLVYVVLSLVFVSKIVDVSIDSKTYESLHKSFNKTNTKMDELFNKFDKEIVFNTFVEEQFFPVKPLQKLENKNDKATFLNYYYFGSDIGYINYWKSLCNCNPLSLEQKLDYVIKEELPFVTTPERMSYLIKYFDEIFDKPLSAHEYYNFSDNLFVYSVKYVSDVNGNL